MACAARGTASGCAVVSFHDSASLGEASSPAAAPTHIQVRVIGEQQQTRGSQGWLLQLLAPHVLVSLVRLQEVRTLRAL